MVLLQNLAKEYRAVIYPVASVSLFPGKAPSALESLRLLYLRFDNRECDNNMFLLQMFDSSQTLLPAEELKKRFEEEGKIKSSC